ncbi:hypothetical protein GGP41_005362 [Bipolaris sorokiniana]|uniref:Uncharacterized protein n=1 Tax=Cochliobolus sativus TaxID=45130 RepID=A0A8H5ZKS9_COCSA|nr:hypothetical protein GGP41_005362 [Bipolaris sorokiniana]
MKGAIPNELVERIRERRDNMVISPTARSLLRLESPLESWVELKYAERAGIERVFGQYLLTSIAAGREAPRAEKNEGYFNFEPLKFLI